MEYKIISCDDHLDLQMLPDDLWTQRMAGSMRDRAPRVEERDGRALWLCEGRFGVPGSASAPRPEWQGRRARLSMRSSAAGLPNRATGVPGLPRCDLPTWTATVCKPT